MSNAFDRRAASELDAAAIADAPFTLAQLYDAIAYGAHAQARSWLLDRFEVISGPREPLAAPLQRGDLLLRRAEGEHAHACLVIDPSLRSPVEILLAGGTVEIQAPGAFAFVAERGARPHEEEDRFARRVTDGSGRVLKRQVVLRPRQPVGEAESIDPVSLMVGMTLASTASRPREAPRPDAASSAGDSGQDAAEEEDNGIAANTNDVWPFMSHRGFGQATAPESFGSKGSAAPAEFASPEHYRLGLGIQELVDGWAKAGLISGGCFVTDTDAAGMTLPLKQWKVFVPDRDHPEQLYAQNIDSRAHWQWIVPNPHRDESGNDWTAKSLATAIQTGKAVPLAIGDIVMLSGDLVGEFADFSAASAADWRSQPVNIAKGLVLGEPFAMLLARRLQFPNEDPVQDVKLMMRARSDYAALQKEVGSLDKTWLAVRSLINFIRKVRGPTGCSELLVLSRLMRREVVSFQTIQNVAGPWLKSTDYTELQLAVLAAGLGNMYTMKIDSDVFQSVVTNGWYAELAMNNEKHFSPANWRAFEAAHTQALQLVERQVPITGVTIEYAPIPANAIAQTAYGLHFLSDAFAAGHMRTPRAALGRAGSWLSKVMHDFDNNLGLIVHNEFAQWRAFGDGSLDTCTPEQLKLVGSEQAFLANRDHAISAMGAAVKQLHYQAQRHFGDTANAALFQGVLGRARGTDSGLLNDDAVPNAPPGDGNYRDPWLAMDIAAKIQFMKKYQPHAEKHDVKWRKQPQNHWNHPPLVVADWGGTLAIDYYKCYSLNQHLATKIKRLYELDLADADEFWIDITKYVLMAALMPDAALSWLGTKELYLGKALRTVHDARGKTDAALRWYGDIPSGLP